MLNKLFAHIWKAVSSWFKSDIAASPTHDLSDESYSRHGTTFFGRIEKVEILQDGAQIVHFEGIPLVEEQLERLRKNGLAMSPEELHRLVDNSVSKSE